MEYPSRGIGARRVALIVALLILATGLGASASYYLVGGSTATAATSTVTSTSTSTTTIGGGSSSVGGQAAISIDAVQIYRNEYQSVVTVDGYVSTNSFYGQVTGEVLGSGFIMNYNGVNYVVTNFHVVNGAKNMTVIFWD